MNEERFRFIEKCLDIGMARAIGSVHRKAMVEYGEIFDQHEVERQADKARIAELEAKNKHNDELLNKYSIRITELKAEIQELKSEVVAVLKMNPWNIGPESTTTEAAHKGIIITDCIVPEEDKILKAGRKYIMTIREKKQ